MKNIQLKQEVEQMLTTGELLNQLFGYAYNHCFSREEAEELCQEMIVQILEGISKAREITNLEGYIWRIARNTYADHVAARKKHSLYQQTMDDVEESHDEGFENQYIHHVMEVKTFKLIRKRIAFLSRIYRDVMVMFYLEEMSIKEIADVLEIPENRVKQRLFTAKQQIKEEVSEMKTNYEDNLLKPVKMDLIGTGNPSKGGDHKLERLIAHSIICACRKEGKTVKDLVEELHVPSVFMEDELEYLAAWPNLLKKVDNKYISDMIVIDEEVQNNVDGQIEKVVEEFSKEIIDYLKSREEQIMNIDYLGGDKSFSFVLWSIIMEFSDQLNDQVQNKVSNHLEAQGVGVDVKDYYLMGTIETSEQELPAPNFYGCNGAYTEEVFGYKSVTMDNYYGYRLPWKSGRFSAGENIGVNSELMMILRVIGGLSVEGLSEREEELVAKAIKKGYVRKEGQVIVPNVVVVDSVGMKELEKHIKEAIVITDKYSDIFVDTYQQLIKKHLPKHLLGQAHIFVQLTMTTLRSYLVEACIQNGLLHIPDTEQCGEGIIVIVEK